MQQFLLQSPLRRILAAVFMMCLLVVSACKDGSDEELAPVTVNFPTANNSSISIGEAVGPKTINLALSGGAVKDGTITVSATGADGVLTVESPISVTKGNTVAILKITPTNNTTIGGDKVVDLTISAVTDGFIIGESAKYKVTIVDDEGPTTAFFENTEASVSEASATGVELTISLSTKATAAGSVTVTLDPTDAPVTTTPAAVDGVITIPVAIGAENVKFTVKPVNDEEDNGDVEVGLTLAGSEGVETNESNKLTLTINDDDAIVPFTIAQIRQTIVSSGGEAVLFNADKYIQGVVTSVSGTTANTNEKSMFVQDESGAINVFFTDAHGIAAGRKVLINIKGSTIKLFNGLVELDATPIGNLTDLGDGTMPAAKLITVEQLASDAFQSQLVKLENVMFPDADGIVTVNGSKTVSDGTNTSIVFVRSQTSFKDQILPLGSGTVQGIASNFNGAQLVPQVAGDYFESNPTGTITLTQSTAIDFGSIANGAKSDPQSYTVNGTGLTQDITVTASANYQVSLTTNDGDFGSTVTLTQAGGTVDQPVYVRFVPATGENKAIDGKITHKSQGALTVNLSVTGTETGAGSSFQTLALWTFETSKPNGAGTAAAATISGIVPEEGTQTATATASGVHASASTVYSNPVGNGSGESFSSNNWAPNDYYQFTASTTGLKDVKISWDQVGSNSGPKDFTLKYSIDGSAFTDVEPYTVANVTWASGAAVTTSTYAYDLSSKSEINNVSTVTFRLVNTTTVGIAQATVGTGGTGRVDNVKIEARP